jgi:uncharacterized protein YbcC (UPF0753/DUF2309 family)
VGYDKSRTLITNKEKIKWALTYIAQASTKTKMANTLETMYGHWRRLAEFVCEHTGVVEEET